MESETSFKPWTFSVLSYSVFFVKEVHMLVYVPQFFSVKLENVTSFSEKCIELILVRSCARFLIFKEVFFPFMVHLDRLFIQFLFPVAHLVLDDHSFIDLEHPNIIFSNDER